MMVLLLVNVKQDFLGMVTLAIVRKTFYYGLTLYLISMKQRLNYGKIDVRSTAITDSDLKRKLNTLKCKYII